MPTNQRTLSCEVDSDFLSQVDQQAHEQDLTRQDWVKKSLQTMMSGEPIAPDNSSEQIIQLLQGLNQRLSRIEEREAQLTATTETPTAVADERIEQVLQWLQVLGQRLQRLEEKEEEPMITQAELIAPDERIDRLLQGMEDLGQQVRQLEANTEDAIDAIATLRPALEASTVDTTSGDSQPEASESVRPEPTSTANAPGTPPEPPIAQAAPTPQPVPKNPIPTSPPNPIDAQPASAHAADTNRVDLNSLLSLEQIYEHTQLDRAAILFFANYLGISEIEAVETRTYWQYDYIEGGFRRRG